MNPADEKEEKRLKALHSLNILFTPNEERFDRITRFATQVFKVPISGISFIDREKEWFKSLTGTKVDEIDRGVSFANEILKSDAVYSDEVINEVGAFKDNPLVYGDAHVRFVAGVALTTPEGFRIGTFIIADNKPHKFTDQEKTVLKDLSIWIDLEIVQTAINYQATPAQRKMQEELAASNRELMEGKARDEAMLESIGDGVIGINDKGEVIFTNEQVGIMTGYSQDELKGKPLWFSIKMVNEEGAEIPVNERPIRNALFERRRIVSKDYYYMRKVGSKFPVSLTASPIVVFDRIIGGIVVFRDITKEKEIDKMKTEFISLASHQLRTPLSAMKWFCEILLDGDAGELSGEQKEVLNNIYYSNERMIQLVNTLLNISRIESGRIIIDPKPTDLKKLLDEVILEVRPRLDKKRHKLVVSIHKDLPLVNIDPKLIRHVYMNLLTNAIKYTPEGGNITVIISKTDKEVISQVTDNGYGIPKEQHSKVFKKFFRAENIVKIETDGTGLGLYLTKSIVDSSGGRIWFESETGKGTSFWFALPLSGSVQKEGEVSLDS